MLTDPAFFCRDAVTVARHLLGQRLVRVVEGQRLAGTIVETEAYLGELDLAAHTAGGRRTARNESMWKAGGHYYVYFTYGMHYCGNVVAGRVGEPVAVLLRAVEPTEGLDAMRSRRPAAKRDARFCSGPAKLCAAFGVDRTFDGLNLIANSDLFIEQLRTRTMPSRHIVTTTRVGVDYAGAWADKPLRFYIAGNEHVSRK